MPRRPPTPLRRHLNNSPCRANLALVRPLRELVDGVDVEEEARAEDALDRALGAVIVLYVVSWGGRRSGM